ncbi:hypothetical protein A7D23_11925 [Dehalobacter sp. TeCB1]|uniref:Uncharacterized protein n=1 Tax=Dehalobacter restrictus (strain DSM 9455 / PER-K23) TaxID=871738 RepID=A0ABM5P994_DEHRP|nr:hypothetical protein DEHRE_08385 [Dehalobacter restrictus DSM 9455]OCZ51997.1 hypothetical protein A7D23_11925 [Dehalobacter sp. TeCB1]
MIKFIRQTYDDRLQMLQQIKKLFFFQYITEPILDWFLQMGLQAYFKANFNFNYFRHILR